MPGWHRKQAENAEEANRKEKIPSPSSSLAISLSPWYCQGLTKRSRQGRKWRHPTSASHSPVCKGGFGVERQQPGVCCCANPFTGEGLLFEFCALKAISMPHMKNECDQGILSLSRHAYKMLNRCAFFKKWERFAEHRQFCLQAIYVRTILVYVVVLKSVHEFCNIPPFKRCCLIPLVS